jgi:hypothetical protein
VAAEVLSRPRLGQCGPLTGQQHFVGINNTLPRLGRDWLLWPPAPVAFRPNPAGGSLSAPDSSAMVGKTKPGTLVSLSRSTTWPPTVVQASRLSVFPSPYRAEPSSRFRLRTACPPRPRRCACLATGPRCPIAG